MDQQVQDLETKFKQIAVLFTQTYLNPLESEQAFMTIYGPMAKYPYPTSSLSKLQLHKIKQPVIKSVLSQLGFNPHMPRSVIDASTRYGGIGLMDLYVEQGCGQVSMLLSHLRYNCYLFNPLLSTIESFMVLSVMTSSPLEDTPPILYIHSLWMHSLRSFLHKHNTQLIIPKLQTLYLLRAKDQPIMNLDYLKMMKKSEIRMVNACRLWLQVTSLAEITRHNGVTILDCAFYGLQSEEILPYSINTHKPN
jgi:hypothetical protein